jgi:hypothetical protein
MTLVSPEFLKRVYLMEDEAMRYDMKQSGVNAVDALRVKRRFWARFWESLRSSLGSACF